MLFLYGTLFSMIRLSRVGSTDLCLTFTDDLDLVSLTTASSRLDGERTAENGRDWLGKNHGRKQVEKGNLNHHVHRKHEQSVIVTPSSTAYQNYIWKIHQARRR